MKKYILCKQIDLTLYAIYNPEDVYGSDYEDENYEEYEKIIKGKVLSNKINKKKLLKSKKSANYDKTNSNNDDSFKYVGKFSINNAIKKNNANADDNEDINTVLRNNFNNLSKNDYNNSKYEKKISDIAKMKDSLSNELGKTRRRYQSIILPNNKDILDFTQKKKTKIKIVIKVKGL
jgi:hypothetical protein